MLLLMVVIVSGEMMVTIGSVFYHSWLFFYTEDILSVKEHTLVAHGCDVTLLVVVPSSDIRSVLLHSLKRDLAWITGWCRLRGMKVSPKKI